MLQELQIGGTSMLVKADPFHAFVDYPDVPVENAASGPLTGLTFAVKDIFDVAGYRTGCGNPEKTAESPPATRHAPAVAALLDTGARFLGKTHTAELAFSLDGRNDHFGTPDNPAAPGRVPGGSSSGSAAAVAGGLVDFALGSDTGGSVRGPASFCGLIGLRPTHARIDIGGVMPLSPSLDTVGWFARSAEVFERVGAVLLGADAAGPALRRMIIAEDAYALLLGSAEDAVMRPAVARVAEHLDPAGARVVAAEGLSAWAQVFRTVQGFEAWQAHGPWIESRRPKLLPMVRGRFEAASRIGAEDYRVAGVKRASIRSRLDEIVGEDGVIVLPTMPTIAPMVDADEAVFEAFRAQALQMLCMSGLSGLPQISLPLGVVDGCPIGLSLIAPRGRDRALIGLARLILEA
jgi:amidase